MIRKPIVFVVCCLPFHYQENKFIFNQHIFSACYWKQIQGPLRFFYSSTKEESLDNHHYSSRVKMFILCCGKYGIYSYSLVTSSLLGPNTLLNTLFSKTLSLRSSLNVTDQVPHPYRAKGNMFCTVLVKCACNTLMQTAPILCDFRLLSRCTWDLRFYAALSGNPISTFRANLSDPSSRVSVEW